MSSFSSVDSSPRPEALLKYLDDTDGSMSAFKTYIVSALHRYAPGGRILDVGCGVGHDLVRLAAAGMAPVGVDLSDTVLRRAHAACDSVVRGDGARLPFQADAFDGCRVERVLQHVADPGVILDEILRVVRPGGVVALLEPDHTSMRVDSAVDSTGTLLSRFVAARHPSIGARTADLLRSRGCSVDDVVTERSFGYDLEKLPVNASAATARAVSSGALSSHVRDEWLAEQMERTRNGSFRAEWAKILVIARAPAHSHQDLLLARSADGVQTSTVPPVRQ